MKKIIFFLSICASWLCAQQCCNSGNCYQANDARFTAAFTAGYVFKNDCHFKEVYGKGIFNMITFDGCYNISDCWGIGAIVSYWRAKGCTTFLKCRTHLQEIPLTFYLRRSHDFTCGLQVYADLGGGFIWVKEKSYLGTVKFFKGIAQVEAGGLYSPCHHLNVTAAVRYLFPRQKQCGEKVDIGGVDLRAGLAFMF